MSLLEDDKTEKLDDQSSPIDQFVPPNLKSEELEQDLKKDFRIDEFIKKYLVRYFRHNLKYTYNWIFKNKRHYSCKRTIWKNLKDFYTGALWEGRDDLDELKSKGAVILRIPEKIYNKHKDIFAVLMFSTQNL